MKKTIFILLISIFLGCSSDSETKSKTFFTIKIGDKTLKLLDKTKFGLNKNCNFIFANVSYSGDSDINKMFRLEFVLTKDGYIKNVLFIDYSNNSKTYNTIDFNPSDTFTISNFENSNGLVAFDYSGTLYEIGSNNTINISGSWSNENTIDVACDYYPFEVSSLINGASLHCTEKILNNDGSTFEYVFFTDNGFMLSLISGVDLKNVTPISNDYNESSNIRFNLKKYIGTNKASTLRTINDSEWIDYNCEGNLRISQQVTSPQPYTSGSFNVIAKDDTGAIVYQLTNGMFKI